MAVGLEKGTDGDKLQEWKWFHPGNGWMVFKGLVCHIDGELLLSSHWRTH